MGISLFSTSSYTCDPPAGNPNPSNFEILESVQFGPALVVTIQYRDCTTYEGKKILVYDNMTIEKLEAQGKIDPHFSEDKNFVSPVARFEPTPYGRTLAFIFCHRCLPLH